MSGAARRIITQPTLGELIEKGLNEKAVLESHEIVLLKEGPVGRTFVGILGMALVGRHGLKEAMRLVHHVKCFPLPERLNKIAALLEAEFTLAQKVYAAHAREKQKAQDIVLKLREKQF